MPILQRPQPHKPTSPAPTLSKKSPHFTIQYHNAPITSPYKLLLMNQYDLLENEFIVAEAREKEAILADFEILHQYLGSMLEGMRNAQIRVERMGYEQVKDLLLGVRERQMRERPELYESENRRSAGFLESVTKSAKNGEWKSAERGSQSQSIASVAEFVEQVETYADAIKRLKKYAEYLEKHKGKVAKHADKSEKKIRASLEEMDRIESAVTEFVNKNRRTSKRGVSSLEGHQVEKTKSQFEEYKVLALSYKSMDVVKRIVTSSSGTRPVSRDVYEEHAKRKSQRVESPPRKRQQSSSSTKTMSKQFNPKSFAQSDSDSDDSGRDYGELEQQLMTGQKFYVSNATMSTVNVEEMIAREKLEELERIEADFNELVELNRDVNGLVHESEAQINHIEKNITMTNRNIERGTSQVKASKKYNLKNALVGGLLR